MKNNSNLKKAAGVVLAMVLMAVNFSSRVQSLRNLPGTLVLDEGQTRVLDFLFPLRAEVEGESIGVTRGKDQTLSDKGAQHSGDTTIYTLQPGEAKVQLSVLGIPVKEVNVQVTPQRVLIPGGQAIGVAMMTDGIYVVDTSNVLTKDGETVNPAKTAGIFPGDTILAINGVEMRNLDQLSDTVQNSASDTLKVRVSHDGSTKTVLLTPAIDRDGTARLGIWGRDSTAGVGTLTYYDPESGLFGALGHAITDSDTRRLLPVREGAVYPSSIVGITQGKQGKPGELRGMFSTSGDMLGSIFSNTEFGVYGLFDHALTDSFYPEGLPVGSQSRVYEGAAQILSSIDGNGVKAYDCRIVKITHQTAPETRSMVIEVTDPELLSKTGGIVQGMSGSPIIQDGYIVGAVTHVYVNDPTRGYGLFIEWMLDAQNNAEASSGTDEALPAGVLEDDESLRRPAFL